MHMSHSDAFFNKRRTHKKIALLFVLFVTIVVVLLGVAGLGIVDGVKRASIVKTEVEDAHVAIIDRDFAEANKHLTIATDEMSAIRARLLSLKILHPIPWVGGQIDTLLQLVDGGTESLKAIQVLTKIGVDIENDLKTAGLKDGLASLEKYSELEPETRRELIFALNRAVPDLEEVRARLGQQRRYLARVDSKDLFFGLRFARDELVDQITIIDNTLELAVPILSILPDVAGFKGEQNYLLLLQNTGELRPTGGFWSTYGVIKVRDGELVDIETDDVYAVDAPSEGHIDNVPPLALQRYIGADDWYLRDANWSPDVPTSIMKGFEFYRNEVNVPHDSDWPVTAPNIEFDGAVLITPEVATSLLRILGDVKINDVEFAPDTFFDVLEYEVEQAYADRGIPKHQRKDIIGDLIDVMFERFQEADGAVLARVLDETLALLDENDIIAYSTRPAVQSIFSQKGWSGELRINPQHDHLMFVDANLAALKTDAMIERSYTYSVHKDAGGDLIATARIDYKHNGDFDYRTTRYRTYARVYAPLGSELISVSGSLLDDSKRNPEASPGDVDVSQDFGATVFGTFTSVEPGATGALEFTYKLPSQISSLVDAGQYTLDVQRQPGVGDVALNIDLDFDVPVSGATPEEISEYWYDDSYTYSTKAVPFQSFVVTF